MTTAHQLMRQWLDSGDPAKVAHARYRLTQPDSAPGPPVDCRHRTPIAYSSCWHCDRFCRKAPAALCAECPEISPADSKRR